MTVQSGRVTLTRPGCRNPHLHPMQHRGLVQMLADLEQHGRGNAYSPPLLVPTAPQLGTIVPPAWVSSGAAGGATATPWVRSRDSGAGLRLV